MNEIVVDCQRFVSFIVREFFFQIIHKSVVNTIYSIKTVFQYFNETFLIRLSIDIF